MSRTPLVGVLAAWCSACLPALAGPIAPHYALVYAASENGFELHANEDALRRVELPGGGKAFWMAGNDRNWSLQWPWPSQELLSGYPYRVTVKARPAHAGKSSTLTAGIYRRFTLRRGETAAEAADVMLPDGTWTELTIGEGALADWHGYVYFLSGPEPVLIESVRLEPVVTEANRDAFAKDHAAMVREKRKQAEQLAQWRETMQPFPGLGDVFLYGGVTARECVLGAAEVTGVPWEWEWREMNREILRNYGNLNFVLSLDAVHPELIPALAIMEAEGIYSVAGDIKILPSIFIVDAPFRPDEFRTRLEKIIPATASFTRFLAWSLGDEPLDTRLYDYIAGKRIVESIAPRRPVVPILNTRDVIRAFGPYVAAAALDFYTQRIGRENPWETVDIIDYTADFMKGPIWLLYGTYANWNMGRKSMRMPTPAEVRLMTYGPFSRNAKGLANYILNFPPVFLSGRDDRTGHTEATMSILRVSTPTWDEIGRVGKRLVPVGTALAGWEFQPDPGLKVATVSIPTVGRERPAIEAGLWRRGAASILMLRNNDILVSREGTMDLAPLRQPGSSLRSLDDGNMHIGDVLNVVLEPGDASFWVAGPKDEMEPVWRSIEQTRLDQEKIRCRLDIGLLAKYGLPDAEARKELAAVQPGADAMEKVKVVQQTVIRALQEKAEYQTKRHALDQLGRVLTDAEWLLQDQQVRGRTEVKALAPEWSDLAKTFGGLRYKLAEGQPVESADIQAALARAVEMGQQLAAKFGTAPAVSPP